MRYNVFIVIFLSIVLFGCTRDTSWDEEWIQEKKIADLTKYVHENYSKYRDLLPVPSSGLSHDVQIIKQTSDTLFISVFIEETGTDSWFLIANLVDTNYGLFAVKIPKIESTKRYFWCLRNGEYMIYEYVSDGGLSAKFRTLRDRSISIKEKRYNSGDWDDDGDSCYTPDCMDGGYLPEIIVYPDNPYDGYWQWWWSNNGNNLVPPSGGGSGTSTSPNNSTPRDYKKSKGDKLVREKFSTSMDKQLPNTCITAICEYIANKFFNRDDINEGDFIFYYLQLTGKVDFFTNGFDSSYLNSFMNHFFKIGNFDSFKTSIDNGYPVMTDIPSEIPNSYHNILVVGYSGNNLIYMDPETGSLQIVDSSYISGHYKIPITGVK